MASKLSTEAGRRIRALRVKRGWRQIDLAAHAGVDQKNLSDIERGKQELSLAMLARIAGALDVPAAELIKQSGFDSGARIRA